MERGFRVDGTAPVGRDPQWQSSGAVVGAADETAPSSAYDLPDDSENPAVKVHRISRGRKIVLLGGVGMLGLLFLASGWVAVSGGTRPAGPVVGTGGQDRPAVVTRSISLARAGPIETSGTYPTITVAPIPDALVPSDEEHNGATLEEVKPAPNKKITVQDEPSRFDLEMADKISQLKASVEMAGKRIEDLAGLVEALRSEVKDVKVAAVAPPSRVVPPVKEESIKPQSTSAASQVPLRGGCVLDGADDGKGEAVILVKGRGSVAYRVGSVAPCIGKIRRVSFNGNRFVVVGDHGRLETSAVAPPGGVLP